ncbi:MAG: ribonuclease D [Magnetococcales bacterium]|nr:ribonuclease D [Magnetococcales bacterium]NGZ07143.1 ribonuclease D [Magnetococcales bacterium]
MTTTVASTHPTLVLRDDLDQERQQLYLESRCLAIDTETMGLKTRRDRLCLVQMCNENGVITLVQIRNMPAPRLQTVLESERVEKIAHFARFDMAAIRHWLGMDLRPVFCTKIASRLTRTFTDRHGLKDLAAELLGVEMNKEQQSSDWAAERLTDKQIAYASADVIHLVALKERLEWLLEREGRLELARACMGFLRHRAALDLAGWEEEDIFAHH